jgi:hypothetical protein
MKYEPMNECHKIFGSFNTFVLNVFLIHNIGTWNVWIMVE